MIYPFSDIAREVSREREIDVFPVKAIRFYSMSGRAFLVFAGASFRVRRAECQEDPGSFHIRPIGVFRVSHVP